jgi:hypothetical protein
VWNTLGAKGTASHAAPSEHNVSAGVKGDSPKAQATKETEAELPADMSTTSLLGGGLIAGESLYFLIVGIIGLLALLG